MPVTAKLSRKFYETFGDDVANELVEWFNQVDAQYKSELKDLAEGYYQRFQADLRAEVGTIRPEMGTLRAELRAELQSEIGGLRAELRSQIGELNGELHSEIGGLRGEMGGLRAELHAQVGGLRGEMGGLRAELLKWMFVFWVGNVAATVGIVFAAIKLTR